MAQQQHPADKSGDLQDLLGKAGSLPVWLDPARFLADDFEAESCIADLRRYVPLGNLQNELQNYLASLKTKLVEVINEDYSDYVSLSSKLVNVDGAVLRMRKPLLELKDKLNIVQEAAKAELTALNQGLKRRKEVATARNLLELLQELAHVASKVAEAAVARGSGLGVELVAAGASVVVVHGARDEEGAAVMVATVGEVEKLLAEVAASHTADLDTRSRLLERVAGEVSRLCFQANRGKDLAFVRSIEPRISGCRKELETHLQAALATALQQRAHAAALHCLRAYVELGEAAPAEGALRSVVISPLVAKIIADHKHHNPHRPGVKGDDSLSLLLSKIFSSVREECDAILGPSLQPHSGLHIFDFLGNAILEEVQSALAGSLPGLFSPGVPPAFHANYLAALRFLDDLESLCQSHGALDKLRSSHAYTAFLKRFNLSVYFSLLYQDIAGALEDATAMVRLEVVSGQPLGLSLPVSSALVACLQRCVSPDSLLLHLADRFLRLVLQLVQRYSHWMGTAIAARKDAAAAAPNQAGVQQPICGLQQQQQSTSLPSVGSSNALNAGAAAAAVAAASGAALGAGAESAAAAQPLAWVTQVPVEDLSVLYQDMDIVSRYLVGSFAAALLALMMPLAQELIASVQASLEDLSAMLASQARTLLLCMADETSERCVALVKQLKGITAAYRMTTKGPPTRHSHYVTGILGPLKQLLDSERVQALPASVVSELTYAVVDTVNGRYQQLADELLTTVRKTESSLKRLKKARPGEADAAGEGAGMSDSDKICLQLYLDVQQYGVQISQLGLDPASMSSYGRLSDLVAPATSGQSTAASSTQGQG